MRRLALATFCVVAAAALASDAAAGTPISAPARTTARLDAALCTASPGERLLVWVHFADKGAWEARKAAPPRDLVSERCLRRRARVLPADRLVDAADLPVASPYLDAVAATGARLRHRSRWFNAVSVEATTTELAAIAALPCVSHLDLVGRASRRAPAAPEISGIDYGGALAQLALIGVPALHDQGLSGSDVLVGHFDDGYARLDHEAFASMRIVAMRDFVGRDGDPRTPPQDSEVGWHGVETLSLLAAHAPGRLVGVAFGASYVLARTEQSQGETPHEEDNWVAAIEWADSLGIDVASTSLGYLEYPPSYPSYTWRDMTGNTAVITRAADMAVARGIVVVNAAGNEGLPTGNRRNTLVAPADGDSVLAVGAVDQHGERASFSSCGPTAGAAARIKPDVMAPGAPVLVASAAAPDAYGGGGGTSFACPLAAGVAALLLEARPGSTPMQVTDAMRRGASNAHAPNNATGWGIVDAAAALRLLRALGPAGVYWMRPAGPNPFRAGTSIAFELPEESWVTLRIYDVQGRRVRSLLATDLPRRAHTVGWDGLDDAGRPTAAGVYWARLHAIATWSATPFDARAKLVRLR